MGNQFLEYSFGHILEKETGKKVCYDLSFYNTSKREKHEAYMLNKYSVDIGDTVFENKIGFLKSKRQLFQRLTSFKEYKKLNWTEATYRFDLVTDEIFGLNRIFFSNPNLFSEKYFNKYREDLLKIFELKVPLDDKNKKMLEEIKKHKNSVSIHVRRGDYLKYAFFQNILTIDNYYNKALKIFDKMDDVHYFIFSDDLEWAKENLKTNKPTTYVDINDGQHGYFDLELMKNCKHNIIANSTLSWWGAYLNNNPDKVIVAPKNFQHGDVSKYRQAMNLKDWIVIDNKIG